jgi:hypothetical protein
VQAWKVKRMRGSDLEQENTCYNSCKMEADCGALFIQVIIFGPLIRPLEYQLSSVLLCAPPPPPAKSTGEVEERWPIATSPLQELEVRPRSAPIFYFRLISTMGQSPLDHGEFVFTARRDTRTSEKLIFKVGLYVKCWYIIYLRSQTN